MAALISVSAAARRLCERSNWKLTNLELQKMLYLAQMQYLGQSGGVRLMDETFEAWDYGPVSPQIYRRVRDFGSGPIRNVFHGVEDISDPELQTYLDGAYDQLSKRSAGQLVAITHWPQGAWAKNYVPGVRGIPIPDEHIIEEYKKRVGA